MATLPPGWAADYDGSRWFFVYEPTGQFQYQFPKPGDEFPDFGGGLALGLGHDLLATELSPEERLESERQVRRQFTTTGTMEEGNLNSRNKQEDGDGAGGRKDTGIGRDDDDDESDAFSFESFAYFGPVDFAREASEEGGGDQQRSAPSVGTGHPHISPPTSANTTPRASISELSAVEIVGEAEHSNPPALSEPSRTQLAVAESAVTAAEATGPPPTQPDGEGDRQLRPTAPEIPMLDGRAIDSVPRMLSFSPSLFMPELYSELTALCEEEINPPPAELPGNGASWLEPVPVANLLNQYPIELPADGHVSSEDGDVCGAVVGLKQLGTVLRNGDDEPERALDSKPNSEAIGEAGKQTNNSSWATLLPPNPTPNESLDEALHREIMGYFPELSSTPGPQHHTIVQKQTSTPAVTGTGSRHSNTSSTREMAHVPSVLRPGPRRSSQPALQQSATTLQPSVTGAAHKAHTWPSQQPSGDSQTGRVSRNNTVLAELPSQASFQSIPIGPPVDMPRPVAAGKGHRAPAAAAVNLVIPIGHHLSSCDQHGAATVAVQKETPTPEYNVSATFASRPPASRPRDAPDAAAEWARRNIK